MSVFWFHCEHGTVLFTCFFPLLTSCCIHFSLAAYPKLPFARRTSTHTTIPTHFSYSASSFGSSSSASSSHRASNPQKPSPPVSWTSIADEEVNEFRSSPRLCFRWVNETLWFTLSSFVPALLPVVLLPRPAWPSPC